MKSPCSLGAWQWCLSTASQNNVVSISVTDLYVTKVLQLLKLSQYWPIISPLKAIRSRQVKEKTTVLWLMHRLPSHLCIKNWRKQFCFHLQGKTLLQRLDKLKQKSLSLTHTHTHTHTHSHVLSVRISFKHHVYTKTSLQFEVLGCSETLATYQNYMV